MQTRYLSCLLIALPLFVGCTALPTRSVSQLPREAARGVVIVVNGAGARQIASSAITNEVDGAHLPLHVQSFDWGHGFGRGLADVVDASHARRQGQRLAAEVRCYLNDHPDRPISLVGYSAGSAVVLAAAEHLPADSLDRIVLLAPAVSACYDLRRALVSARRGLDSFYSKRDWVYLGMGTAITGTPDGSRGATAGRTGFRPLELCPGEEALACRFRQHAWTREVAWTGNRGGHGGVVEPIFLRTQVVPLLVPPVVTRATNYSNLTNHQHESRQRTPRITLTKNRHE